MLTDIESCSLYQSLQVTFAPSNLKSLYALFVTSKIEFYNPPILQFKRLQKAFEIKKTRLKFFFNVINKNYVIHHSKGVLKGSLVFMQHFKFENWRNGEFDFWCHEQTKKYWSKLTVNFESHKSLFSGQIRRSPLDSTILQNLEFWLLRNWYFRVAGENFQFVRQVLEKIIFVNNEILIGSLKW